MAVALQYNLLYNNPFKNLPLYLPGKTSLKAKELPTTYDQQREIETLVPFLLFKLTSLLNYSYGLRQIPSFEIQYHERQLDIYQKHFSFSMHEGQVFYSCNKALQFIKL